MAQTTTAAAQNGKSRQGVKLERSRHEV